MPLTTSQNCLRERAGCFDERTRSLSQAVLTRILIFLSAFLKANNSQTFFAQSYERSRLGFAALLMLIAATAAIETFGQEISKIRLSNVRPDKQTARVYERVTIEMDLLAAYDNPFDSEQIAVDADITAPSGKQFVVPGFLYQQYDRTRRDDAERLAENGTPRWQIRFSGEEAGKYKITVRAKDKTGTASAAPVDLTITKAAAAGFVRRAKENSRYFLTDRGESFFPIGLNLAWGWGEGRTYDYDFWLAELAKNKVNYVRLWLAPHDNPHAKTFALYTPNIKFHRFDLENAWRLDHVLETAENLDIRAMLCVNTHSSLVSVQKYRGLFEDLTLHYTHGGPLKTPTEFWTNEAAKKEYRDRLRYIVARYGYSPNVFAWELWNEVDLTADYNFEVISEWHRENIGYLRKLDPWRHLVTTSNAKYRNPLPAAESLDLYQDHTYQWKDDGVYGDQRAEKRTMPYLYGEFGIPYSSIGGATIQAQTLDPAALHLHNALFASVGQAQSGTPMAWFWYNYLEPGKHYPIYKSFANWIEGFDFIKQNAMPFGDEEVHADSDKLKISGVRGQTQGLIWVWNRTHNYEQVRTSNAVAPVAAATLELTKIPAGDWTIEFYDTALARTIKTEKAKIGNDGLMKLRLPTVTTDLALRFRR